MPTTRDMETLTAVRTSWRQLVDEARFAPSPHNTQPWGIRVVGDDAAELYVPIARTLPVEDVDGKFLTAGVGIFLEALDVAAGARGLALDFEPLYPNLGRGATEPALAARLRLVPRDEPARFDAALLRRRRTSRLPYDGRPASAGACAVLGAIAAEHGHRATFTSRPDDVRWVVGLNADTVFDDLREDDRREEIGSWTHFSERDAASRGDGFSPECLGFHPILLRTFFRHHRLCEPRIVRALLRRVYLRSMRGTATVGWIAGPWSTPPDCLEAGRMLMRFWLAATAHGLVLQPFGSVITNPTAHARMTEKLRVDENDAEVWLLFRIGYSGEPPRSARRPVVEVVS